MESNECICYNLMQQLQSIINGVLTTTANTMINANTPGTDSGYTSFNTIQPNMGSNNFLNLNTVFYSGLIIAAMILFLSRSARRINGNC